MARQALGRGLSALLATSKGSAPMHEIPVDMITPNRAQPRKRFNPASLAELAETIKAKGLAQPVLVRRAGDRYELIAGERRWRAARLAGLKTIPAVLREASDREALELALVENLQREDLNPLDEAAGFQVLLKDMTQEELGRRVGRDRATVANTLRLLKLPREVQDAVADDRITAGHARAILQLETPAAQIALFRRILRDGLSVRAAESAAQRLAKPGGGRVRRGAIAADEDLSRALGTKVRIRRSGKRGAIVIEFYSAEELDRLVHLLGRAGR
jgi:ParB family chromosome partitioning protein